MMKRVAGVPAVGCTALFACILAVAACAGDTVSTGERRNSKPGASGAGGAAGAIGGSAGTDFGNGNAGSKGE